MSEKNSHNAQISDPSSRWGVFQRIWSLVAGGALGVFLLIITALHFMHEKYNPCVQLMSELALGPLGGMMFFAFAALALAVHFW